MIIFYLSIAFIGLIIGSFLNVVIYRLPIMLQQQWQQQCAELLNKRSKKTPAINLFLPRSHCPACKSTIPYWLNIPLIGFLILKGKCAKCRDKISWRYPLVEILSAIASVIVFYYFGLSWQCLAALVFTWILLTLIFIDFAHQLLPDDLTLTLLWVGLLSSTFNLFTNPTNAIIGAIVGYLSLWIIGWLFKKIRGIEGMGYGDYKLFAALGAWFGWQMLPLILFIAALIGAIIGITLLAIKKIQRTTPFPFGPYLAIGGWIALTNGEKILQSFFNLNQNF